MALSLKERLKRGAKLINVATAWKAKTGKWIMPKHELDDGTKIYGDSKPRMEFVTAKYHPSVETVNSAPAKRRRRQNEKLAEKRRRKARLAYNH